MDLPFPSSRHRWSGRFELENCKILFIQKTHAPKSIHTQLPPWCGNVYAYSSVHMNVVRNDAHGEIKSLSLCRSHRTSKLLSHRNQWQRRCRILCWCRSDKHPYDNINKKRLIRSDSAFGCQNAKSRAVDRDIESGKSHKNRRTLNGLDG